MENLTNKLTENINIDNFLLKERRLFIFDEITCQEAEEINKRLIYLSNIDYQTPIFIEMNSPGGDVVAGISILNTIKTIKCPVITVINGQVASIASIISIVGDYRMIMNNSQWMIHDMQISQEDYFNKIKARAACYSFYSKVIEDVFRQTTKLKSSQIEYSINKELWLSPRQCLKYGIVDKIIYPFIKIKKEKKS